MVNSTPNPIKEHYIAYMDVLGYKAFFDEHPDEISNFHSRIDTAVKRTIAHIETINKSPLLGGVGNITVKTKVFSDNILLCMETSNNENELWRALAFLQVVADIQRGLVIECGLFVRGGITKGQLSVNDDYIFGKGLIDAVQMEEKEALYPRIIVNQAFVDELFAIHFLTEDEVKRAVPIEQAIIRNEAVSKEDNDFYNQLRPRIYMNGIYQNVVRMLIWFWNDEKWYINYLQRINANDLIGSSGVDAIKQTLQSISPSDYALVIQPSMDIDSYLEQHENEIIKHLREYGHNEDINTGDKAKDIKIADNREHVLRKYMWAMAYHNRFCTAIQKDKFFISTTCNCDARFLKMTIQVQNNEAKV